MDVGGEIRLGSMLFTLVEPHRGHEVAYNRWYERDHFYAGCMVGPWLFSGRRWVATRDLKDLRVRDEPPLFGDHALGSYLATYFVIEGKHDEHFKWGLDQVRWLHANGRMFAERDHIHTLLYRYRGADRRSEDGVPPELALEHPFPGLVAVMAERDDAAAPDAAVPGYALTSDSAIALVLTFEPVPLPPDAPVSQPGLEGLDRRELQLWFVDTDPRDVWPAVVDYADALADLGTARVRWASPFVPTIPGTDRFTDQLW
jgi:hypothetical protein